MFIMLHSGLSCVCGVSLLVAGFDSKVLIELIATAYFGHEERVQEESIGGVVKIFYISVILALLMIKGDTATIYRQRIRTPSESILLLPQSINVDQVSIKSISLDHLGPEKQVQ